MHTRSRQLTSRTSLFSYAKVFAITSTLSLALWTGGMTSDVYAEPQAAQVSATAPNMNIEPTPEMEAKATKRINRLSDELKSPFCPGKTLLTCTSPEAFKLRREMRQLIFKGYSDDDIMRELRSSFGERLENPPQPWFTVIIPILPFVFGGILALGMFIYWLSSSKRAQQAEEDTEELEHDERHHERLRALLRDED